MDRKDIEKGWLEKLTGFPSSSPLEEQFEIERDETKVSRFSESEIQRKTASGRKVAQNTEDLIDSRRLQSAFNGVPEIKNVELGSGSSFWQLSRAFSLASWLNPPYVKPISQALIPKKMEFSSIKNSLSSNLSQIEKETGSTSKQIITAKTQMTTAKSNMNDTDVAKVMMEQQAFFNKIFNNC